MGYLELQENHPNEALAAYRSSFETASKLGERRRMTVALLGTAGVLLASNEPAAAVRSLGAAARLGEDANWRLDFLPHMVRAEYATYESRAREQLSQEAFDTAWEEGRNAPPHSLYAFA